MSTLRSRGRALAVLLAAVLLLGGVAVVPAYGAAMTFTPSLVEAPQYTLNDHTVMGVRFAVAAGSGLAAGDYYVKLRFTNTPSHTTWDSSLTRGLTWNASTVSWVPEADAWTDFPVVTVAADGSIPQGWVFGKFGDETAAAGPYYAVISLKPLAGSDTYNSTVAPAIAVLDAKTGGAWIHNGVEMSSTYSGKRVAVRASDSTGDLQAETSLLYSLYQAEIDAVDGDSNGIVDDEAYGPTATNIGDYRISVPLGVPFDAYINRKTPALADNMTITVADTDIAIGGSEQTAPSAVTGLTATANQAAVDLSWTAATDAGGSELAGYDIYRWEVYTGPAVRYTPVPLLIASIGADTSFTDTNVVYGTEYAYEVRAVDGATNIGPRSNTDTASVGTPTAFPVYRFYNVKTGTHFYTASEDEKNSVIANLGSIFRLEGVAYSVDPWQNSQPLYRFYNKKTGTHFYTASDDEKNSVIANLGGIFTYEGVGYYLGIAGIN